MSDNTSLTVGFKADTSGFKKGMDDVINKLNELNKQLVDNQYKQRDSNKVISDAKKELRNIQKEIGENGEANEEQKNRIDALNRTIEEETLKLSQLRTEQASLRSCISQTTGELVNNNEQWSTLKATIANLASDTLQRLGAALRNVVADIIRTGEEFSASISKVAAISGATQEELEQLEEAARAYGASTMFSATEAADALQYMALAGWNAEQSIEGLPAVLDLAASSGMDLGRASDIVTDYITAFGLSVDDAARFVDIMSYAMSNSNTTTEMLGEAYKNCAATARSMGFSVEETTAALMTMANAGVKGGEAGTTLNTLMTRLATDAKGCASALKEYGVRIYDSEGNMKSLSDILSGLIGVWDTLTQKQQANLSKMIAGTNQYSGFQTLMQGMSDKAKAAGMSFDDYTQALENCTGTASKMSDTMANNLSGDIRIMNSAFDELRLKIFEDAEQPLRNIVKWITQSGIPTLEALVSNIDKIIPVVVAATAALVSYRAALAIQSIIKGVQQGLTALRAARAADTAATQAETAAQTSLNTAQAANPIGLLIGLIGGLAAGIGSLVAITNSAAISTKNYNSTLDDLLKKQSEAEAEAYGESEKIRLLKEEYDRLRNSTDLTVREKERLQTVCEELTEKLGITTEELKTQQGVYKDLTEEVNSYIDKLKEKAKYEYFESIIKESAKAVAQIEADMELIAKAKKALKDGDDELFQQTKKQLEDLGYVYGIITTGVDSFDTAYMELERQLEKAQNALENAEEGYRALGEASDDTKDKTHSLSTVLSDGVSSALMGLLPSIEEVDEAIADAEKQMEELEKEQTRLTQQSSTLRGEMNSLASSLAQLEQGESLSLDTILQLIEKYPDYTSQLIAATGNVDLQKEALKALFDAKKAEYILTQQAAIDNINASDMVTGIEIANAKLRIDILKQEATAKGDALQKLASIIGAYATLAGLESKLTQNAVSRDNLQQRIDWVQGLNYEDFVSGKGKSKSVNTTTGSGSSGGSGSTGKSDSKWTMDSRGVYAEGNSYLDAYTKWMDRAKTVGKLTADEEIQLLKDLLRSEKLTAEEREQVRQRIYSAEEKRRKAAEDAEKDRQKAEEEAAKAKEDARKKEISDYLTWIDRKKSLGELSLRAEIMHLEELLKRENLTADERYNIDLRLYNARNELESKRQKSIQERADKEAKAVEEAEQKKREARELGKAALDKLIDDEIAKHEAAANGAKEWADKEIAALDEVARKRKQEQSDKKRQNELDLIDLKLRSGHLSEFEKRELERRKQDILNEQYEEEYEQSIEARKTDIQTQRDNTVSLNQQAINALRNSKTVAADRVAYLNGTQSYDQRVKNNNVTQNVTIVQNGLGGDQLIEKIKKELGVKAW